MGALVSYLRKQTSSKYKSKYLNSPAWRPNPDPANDVRSNLKEIEWNQFEISQIYLDPQNNEGSGTSSGEISGTNLEEIRSQTEISGFPILRIHQK